MQSPRPSRHYGTLREAEREVSEQVGEASPTPERFSSDTPTAEFTSEIDLVEARRAAQDAELQEKVDQGKISASEKVYQLARFDNQELVAMKQAELREARELAAAAREHEAAEQSRAHELDGPER